MATTSLQIALIFIQQKGFQMEKSTIVAIVVLLVVVIGFAFKKLMDSEVKKNDPTLDEPRDSNTKSGNQGVKNHRNKK